MRIDLQLDAGPIQAAERARWLADTGVDGVFSFEGQHDAFLPLALATAATGLPVMTNVAIALPRSPLHLAHLAHDLQLLSAGGFTLGLGSQVKAHIERRYGSSWSKPAARMGEIVAATREILAAWDEGRAPSFHGEFTRHDFMPPNFTPAPGQWGPPPVMMGALGPLMTRTAGEVADGLLIMPFNTRRHMLERTLPNLREGIERAGRRTADVAIVPEVIIATGHTEAQLEEARTGARGLVAFYASTPAYRPVLEVDGREDLQPHLQSLVRSGDYAAMSGAIDQDLFDDVVVHGTPEECAQQLEARLDGVSDRVCAYFPGYQPTQDLVGELVDAVHAITAA